MKSFNSSKPSAADGYIDYTFSFEQTFTIPQILMDGTVKDVQEFLGFFNSFLRREHEVFNRQHSGMLGASIEESVRRTMSEEHRIETQRMQKELEQYERRYREISGEAAAMRGQLECMKAQMRGTEDDIKMRVEESWRLRQLELKEEHEKMCTYLKTQLGDVREELRGAQEKLMGRESVLKSSVRRGRAGEDMFAEAAMSACGWNLERTAGVARACDFQMNYADCLVRFEIKNHETSVPIDDIKKFRRDMEEHRNDTGVGIFVALNAHLGGFMKGRTIHQEWKDDSGQLLIYISAFNELDSDFVFLLIKQVLDVFVKYKGLREADIDDDGGGSVTADGLRARIDSAMIHSQSMLKHLKELTLKVGRDKKTVMKMYDDSLELLKSMSAEYTLMVSSMLGEAETEDMTSSGSGGGGGGGPIIDVDSDVVVIDTPPSSEPSDVKTVVKKKKSRTTKTNITE